MVQTVNPGGFFSSSTSSYRGALTLEFLWLLNEEEPMKVSPWNQCQSAGQEAKHNVQFAYTRMAVSQRCASLIRFLHSCTRIKRLSPLKLFKRQRSETASDCSTLKVAEDSAPCDVVDVGESKLRLKSCLKKRPKDCCPSAVQVAILSVHCTEIKKVHWSDSCGKELAEVMMFEDRNDGSSD